MEIKGKVHCFFEQSGTFKNEFIKLGIPAEDYDIQNNFGETDHVSDLFKAIEDAYDNKPSLFDSITKDDLIVAFFPCIHFCDAKVMVFKGESFCQKKWSMEKVMNTNIELSRTRQKFFELLMMLVSTCCRRGIRLIIENPWSKNGMAYLQNNFVNPTVIDEDRTRRGDYFKKPTAYWFLNCVPTHGFTLQPTPKYLIKTIKSSKKGIKTGICSEERSMISPDYARNWICDFVLGKVQEKAFVQLSLFN